MVPQAPQIVAPSVAPLGYRMQADDTAHEIASFASDADRDDACRHDPSRQSRLIPKLVLDRALAFGARFFIAKNAGLCADILRISVGKPGVETTLDQNGPELFRTTI